MLDFIKSTVGRKYIMAITGLVWMLFIIGHMLGNMLILVSSDLYNAYGHAIVSNKLLLYTTEVVLVLAILTHIITAFSLTIQNFTARDHGYAVMPKGQKAASMRSRTMILQGSVILAFIILHLISFKYGTVYETNVNGTPMRDLHKLVVETFQQPLYVGWYVAALLILMMHLSHGAHSIFQTFGIMDRKLQKKLHGFAWAYAVIVVLGFISQPLYVFLFHK